MSAIAGINGDVWLSTSPPTALVAAETCNDSGNHINYFAAVHQGWDQTQPFTVQNSPNGSSAWVTVTDYDFYWPAGEVVFHTARTPGVNDHTQIITGSYFTLSALAGAHAWSMSMTGNVKDVTPFQASGAWTLNLATLKTMTFNVDCYAQEDRILQEMISAGISKTNISGGIILCQLWFNETNGDRWQFYAFPTGVNQTVKVDDVDQQQVTFQSTGAVYYISSNTFTTATVIQA
jgi:hypothetical protein